MEKIIVKVEVDGVELASIDMGEAEQSHFYKDSLVFFKMGNLVNKEKTLAPYGFMIRLDRLKTKEEGG